MPSRAQLTWSPSCGVAVHIGGHRTSGDERKLQLVTGERWLLALFAQFQMLGAPRASAAGALAWASLGAGSWDQPERG